MKSTRREFLKSTGAGTAALAGASMLSGSALSQETLPILNFKTPDSTRQGDMLYRTLGKTNEKLSLVGFGGAHIGGMQQDQATRLIRSSIDRGITFMDNCWDYSNGQAEVKMGVALRDGYRAKAFQMTKFDGRTKAVAAKQLEESLQRLQTDHIDLFQLHEVIHDNDPDRFFATGGAHEAVREAIKAGKARHFGITGHKDPSFFIKFMEAAKKNDLRIESVQMPLNPLDAHFKSFAQQIIPLCLADQIGVLAMKVLAAGAIPRDGVVTAPECLRYAMTLPTACVITGLDTEERIDQAITVTKTFEPYTREQMTALLTKTRAKAADGALEAFKTTPRFDGTTRNPAWMG